MQLARGLPVSAAVGVPQGALCFHHHAACADAASIIKQQAQHMTNTQHLRVFLLFLQAGHGGKLPHTDTEQQGWLSQHACACADAGLLHIHVPAAQRPLHTLGHEKQRQHHDGIQVHDLGEQPTQRMETCSAPQSCRQTVVPSVLRPFLPAAAIRGCVAGAQQNRNTNCILAGTTSGSQPGRTCTKACPPSPACSCIKSLWFAVAVWCHRLCCSLWTCSAPTLRVRSMRTASSATLCSSMNYWRRQWTLGSHN